MIHLTSPLFAEIRTELLFSALAVTPAFAALIAAAKFSAAFPSAFTCNDFLVFPSSWRAVVGSGGDSRILRRSDQFRYIRGSYGLNH
jgi:hypothetical protein